MAAASGGRRLIIVTGASTGVGRATAKALAMEHGCEVLAVARSQEKLAGLEEECAGMEGTVVPLPVDLTARDAVARIVGAVGGRRLYGLVNNAGAFGKRPLGEWDADEVQRLFHVNATVPLLLTQALAPRLQGDPPGHVLNIGSMGGFQGSVKFPGLAAYSASKAALANLTECLAEELKEQGVHCNCVCLGAVDTAMLRAAFPGYEAPVGPTEVGSWLARFLMEGHNYFNGKVLPFASSTP